MELVATRRIADFEVTKSLAKRARTESLKGEPVVTKRRQLSADGFCFSFGDLSHTLHSRQDQETSSRKDAGDGTVDDFCFWCDAKRYKDDFKCPYHGNESPLKKELPYAYQNIPKILQLHKTNTPSGVRTSVQTLKALPAGAWLGPYEGKFVRIDEAPLKKTNYMWEIFKNGKLFGFIDGSDENTSSWMRFIRCARHKGEQNLYAFQYLDKIYYRTYKTILPGQELLVWYDDLYTQYLEKQPSGSKKNKDDTLKTPVIVAINEQSDVRDTSQSASIKSPVSHGGLQMETTFQRLASLITSPSKPANRPIPDTETHQDCKKQLSFFTEKPVALISKGFSLQISNNHVTSAAHTTPVSSSALPISHSLGRSPSSPISPVTPSSSDSGFSDEGSPFKAAGVFNETSLWRCGQCNKSFAQRALLQCHVCYQVPFRPYKCGHCDQSFASSGEMRSHAVIHQGRKPFKCGYCSRSFTGATTLNNHIRIHTGEKPFDCQKCGKSFSQGSQLSKHENIPGDCIPK